MWIGRTLGGSLASVGVLVLSLPMLACGSDDGDVGVGGSKWSAEDVKVRIGVMITEEEAKWPYREEVLAYFSKASFMQPAIYEGSCPSAEALESGSLSGCAQVRSRPFESIDAVQEGDVAAIGVVLGKKTYGFAGFLRDKQCGVMGYGCTNADMAQHKLITISINTKVDASTEGKCIDHAANCFDDGICGDEMCPILP